MLKWSHWCQQLYGKCRNTTYCLELSDICLFHKVQQPQQRWALSCLCCQGCHLIDCFHRSPLSLPRQSLHLLQSLRLLQVYSRSWNKKKLVTAALLSSNAKNCYILVAKLFNPYGENALLLMIVCYLSSAWEETLASNFRSGKNCRSSRMCDYPQELYIARLRDYSSIPGTDSG